mmetsp:Transcript_30397/g.65061  ORF Transcript_30397/g.65061 Transcript_30397/m.65061 type:complete len:268 (-) Transcript_30397:178-981(-)
MIRSTSVVLLLCLLARQQLCVHAGLPPQRDTAGPGHLQDVVGLEHLLESRHFVQASLDLDGDASLADVADLGPEYLGQVEDLPPLLHAALALDQHELPAHVGHVREVLDLHAVHELQQLLAEVVDGGLRSRNHEADPGEALPRGVPDGEGLDVVAPSGEHAGHLLQHSRDVLHEERHGVPLHSLLLELGLHAALALVRQVSNLPNAARDVLVKHVHVATLVLLDQVDFRGSAIALFGILPLASVLAFHSRPPQLLLQLLLLRVVAWG